MVVMVNFMYIFKYLQEIKKIYCNDTDSLELFLSRSDSYVVISTCKEALNSNIDEELREKNKVLFSTINTDGDNCYTNMYI